MDSMYKVIWP